MPETSTPPYRKLPGLSFGFLSISRLWLGGDHILLVRSVFGVEHYRRFYLRDIEAIIVQRTGTRLVWNGVLGGLSGVLAAICALIWLAGVKPDGPSRSFALGCVIFLGVITALCLGSLLINTLRGPVCAVFVQNAAGLEWLSAPRRIPSARRMLERVQPVVAAAQRSSAGDLQPAAALEEAAAALP